MLVAVKNEIRPGGRVSLSLSAVVKAKEDQDSIWKENTELVSISRSGAGFYLGRKCEVGRLVSLMIPMPKHLRCYDTNKELYRVWGLVQHCSPVSGDGSSFHVGVAFTGKSAPWSYEKNPLQSYRIAGINENGTWRIVEADRNFIVRRHPRFQASLEIFLSAHDQNRNLMTDEAAKTENISASGAAVFSTLNLDIGDSVKFDCVSHNFSTLAIVRNRMESDHEPPRLHLEFINNLFPVEELPAANNKHITGEGEEKNEFFYS